MPMPTMPWVEIWHRSAEGEFSGVFPENFKGLVGSPTHVGDLPRDASEKELERAFTMSQLRPASHWLTPIWHRSKLGLQPPL